MKSKRKEYTGDFLCMICCLPVSCCSSSNRKIVVKAEEPAYTDRDQEGKKQEIIQAVTELRGNVLKTRSPLQTTMEQQTAQAEFSSDEEESVNKSELEAVIGFRKEDDVHLSVCNQCVIKMKETTAARLETVHLEQEVRTLQGLLLRKLRLLQEKLSCFYERMSIMEETVTTAETSKLEASLGVTGSNNRSQLVEDQCNVRREWVIQFRREIVQASKDVNLYKKEISNKVGQEKSMTPGTLLPRSPPSLQTLYADPEDIKTEENDLDEVAEEFDEEEVKIEIPDYDGDVYFPDDPMDFDFEQSAAPEVLPSTVSSIASEPAKKIEDVPVFRPSKKKRRRRCISDDNKEDKNAANKRKRDGRELRLKTNKPAPHINAWTCGHCHLVFSQGNKARHEQSHSLEKRFPCPFMCGYGANRTDSLSRHILHRHKNQSSLTS